MNRLRTRLVLAMRRLPFQVLAFSVLVLIVAACIKWPRVGIFVLAWIAVGFLVALVLMGQAWRTRS